jgi:hypothetical protein
MNVQINPFLYGRPLYKSFEKFVEERFEGVIPFRRGGCSTLNVQATASPDEHELFYPRGCGGT